MIKKICLLTLLLSALCATELISFAQESAQKEITGKIAFCQRDDGYWQVWTMDLDGSNQKKLTTSQVDKRSPDISSDGKTIAYATNEGKLWIMDSNGSNNKLIPVAISVREPRWCFNDTKIIFTSYKGIYFLDDSDIWMVNSNGSGLTKIVRRPSLQFLPYVSKDNKEMLFVDVLEISSHEIFSFNFKTGDCRQLTDNIFHDTDPVFTPDNNKVVYACDQDGNYDIWIMDHFGQNKQNLTHHPAFDASPQVANDGKTIFFLSDRNNGMQIWRMDIDGHDPKQITNDHHDKQDLCVITKKEK